jgi:hypothetical protein
MALPGSIDIHHDTRTVQPESNDYILARAAWALSVPNKWQAIPKVQDFHIIPGGLA